MANWKALNWAEKITAGGPIARSALDKIALRVNDEFELYSPLPRIARLCELTPRRMRDALDKLEASGWITRVRRLRAAGAEGTPLLLLNHPDAPHLNNTPVVLDYQGNYLYPRSPEALSAAGISWISGGEVNRVHPSHAGLTENGRTLPTGGRTERPPTGRTERPWGEDGTSPHGGDGTSPLNPPPGISTQPTKPPADDDGAEMDGIDGWLGSTTHGEKTEAPSTEGRHLLQEWGVAGRVLDEWASVVDEAFAALGHQEARATLTGNLGGVNSPAGVIVKRRLPALRDRLSAAASSREEHGRKLTEEQLNARAESHWHPDGTADEDGQSPAGNEPPAQSDSSARAAARAAAPKAKRPIKGTPQWKQRLDEAQSASPDQVGDLLGETIGRLH